MIAPKLILILLNAVGLLLLARAQLVPRRVAREQTPLSPRMRAEYAAVAPTPPAAVPPGRPARIRGEARLVDRVARWRAQVEGGESLPRAAETCRPQRRGSMTERIA